MPGATYTKSLTTFSPMYSGCLRMFYTITISQQQRESYMSVYVNLADVAEEGIGQEVGHVEGRLAQVRV